MKLKELPISFLNSALLLSINRNKFLKTRKKNIPVIISLTSIPSRLTIIHLTIRSILNQDVRPLKIILWLNKSLKDKIPTNLKLLESDLFEILFSDLTCSHKKLIHTLDLFQEKVIITCDDDMIYRKNWMRLLYMQHLKNPKCIIANQTRYIRYSSSGELLPYKFWETTSDSSLNPNATLAIGAEGVLYPPFSLAPQTTNSALFLELSPKADDLWFKVMALLNETQVLQANQKAKAAIPIIASQKESLKSLNVGKDKNREQWLKLTSYFGINYTLFQESQP
jgi:hypothetical protein